MSSRQNEEYRTEEYPSYKENGRSYHGFRRGIYMYPCDDQEQERLDIFHKLFSVARKDCLYNVPLDLLSNPAEARPRILDLGCGTGIWAIDVAKRYPKGYILGVDLAPIQPSNGPPNCEFQAPRDYESPWMLGEDSWDMVHLQMGCGSVSNWPNLYRKVFAHLRPGGYFEQVEINFEPHAYGGFNADHPLNQWYTEVKSTTFEASRPIAVNRNAKRMLESEGFVNVVEESIMLPLNTWPDDPHEKTVGKWYNLAFSESTEPLLLGPMTRVKGWSVAQIETLAQDTSSQAYDKECKAWNRLHIYTAQKPEVYVLGAFFFSVFSFLSFFF